MRLLHKLYARATGHFWKPCPICGYEFGGHEVNEWTESVEVPGRENEHVVCVHCSRVFAVQVWEMENTLRESRRVVRNYWASDPDLSPELREAVARCLRETPL